jgi:hypothetical protein
MSLDTEVDIKVDVPSNDEISKIKMNSFLFQNECEAYKLLQQIPKYQTHFYIFNNITPISYDEIQIVDAKTETFLVKYKKKRFFLLEEVLSSFPNSFSLLKFVICLYPDLLHVVSLLSQQGIIHNNICYDSILIDELETITLFNFELCLCINDTNQTLEYINKYIFVYQPDYFYWPLEIHILSYLLSNKKESITKLEIEMIVEEVFSKNMILTNSENRLSPASINDYKKSTIDFFAKYANKSVDFIVKEIFQYSSTWDSYRVSILLLDILENICKKTNDNANQFIIQFIELLHNYIIANPNLRPSIQEMKDKFEELCYKTEPPTYRNLIEQIKMD